VSANGVASQDDLASYYGIGSHQKKIKNALWRVHKLAN